MSQEARENGDKIYLFVPTELTNDPQKALENEIKSESVHSADSPKNKDSERPSDSESNFLEALKDLT